MRKKEGSIYLIIGILILSIGASVIPIGTSTSTQYTSPQLSPKATWIVDDEGDGDFTSIQAAIDNATADDIIEIYSGTYTENILIEKSIDLEGKATEYGSGSDTGIPTLIGLGNDNVISIYTDNLDAPVKIAGLTITGSGDKHAGVYAEYSKTVVVTNNIITENHHGVELYYDETAQIQANTISDNDYAIIIEFCSYCTVSLNHIVNNSYGIQMSVSNSNEIKQNEIKNTQNGYSITLIRSYVNQITFNNFIDNNKQATFLNCLNYWHDNYWSNKLGILPVYIIFGFFQLNFFPTLRLPWPQFDLRAADSPNPI